MTTGYICFPSFQINDQFKYLKEYFTSYSVEVSKKEFKSDEIYQNLKHLLIGLEGWLSKVNDNEFSLISNALFYIFSIYANENSENCNDEFVKEFCNILINSNSLNFKTTSRLNLFRTWFWANKYCKCCSIFLNYYLLLLEKCDYPADFMLSRDDISVSLQSIQQHSLQMQITLYNSIFKLITRIIITRQFNFDLLNLCKNVIRKFIKVCENSDEISIFKVLSDLLFYHHFHLYMDTAFISDIIKCDNKFIKTLFQIVEQIKLRIKFCSTFSQNQAIFEKLGVSVELIEKEMITFILTTISRSTPKCDYEYIIKETGMKDCHSLEMFLYEINEAGMIYCTIDPIKKEVYFRWTNELFDFCKSQNDEQNLQKLIDITRDIKKIVQNDKIN